MKSSVKRILLLSNILLSGYACLLAQTYSAFHLDLYKGQSSAAALSQFQKTFRVRIAFDPSLDQHPAPFTVRLQGNTKEEVFAKLCEVYRLEYLLSDPFSYLVRSTLRDVTGNTDKIVHIHVAESEEGAPVSYAAVFNEDKSVFGFTDEFGDCFIRIPSNSENIEFTVHSLAHSDQRISIGKESQQQSMVLYADPVVIPPVQIKSNKQYLSSLKGQATGVSHQLLDLIVRSSAFSGDVVRSIQLLPGVNAIDDARSSIRVRGANEESTLLLLDHMPVYRADHFFGVFGAFNALYIRNVELYKNNIPAQFGGRTGAMASFESDDVAPESVVKADINALYSSIMADWRISPSWLLKTAVRKSYTNLANGTFYDLSQRDNIGKNNLPVNLQNIITSRPSFDFYDGNLGIVFQRGRHSAELNGFVSQDAFTDQFSSAFRIRQNLISDESFRQKNHWNNLASSFHYTYTRNEFDLGMTIYATRNASTYDISSTLLRREPGVVFRDTVSVFNENTIFDTGIKGTIDWGMKRRMYAGADIIRHSNLLYIENERFPIFEINRTGTEASVWLGSRIGEKSRFFADPALRITYLPEFNRWYALPQFYFSAMLPREWLMKASAGRHMQYVRQIDHENPLGQRQQFFAVSNGSSVPVAVGLNTMAGVWKQLGDVVIDIEAYYRGLDGNLMHASQMPGLRLPGNTQLIQGFKLYDGDLRVAGVDVSLIYQKPWYFFMATYTLSKSENRFTGIFNQLWYPSTEDSRHQIKWLNTFFVKQMECSLVYVGATGRPYLDVSSLDKSVDRATIDPTLYIKKLSDYHRFDAGCTYNFELLGVKAKVGGAVYNLFNRTNVKYRQFFFRLPSLPGNSSPSLTSIGSDVSQLERTFSISLSLQFAPGK